jgi:hypothetical protein
MGLLLRIWRATQEVSLGFHYSFECYPGEMSQPRPQEVAAVITCIRSLEATTG